MTDYTCQSCQQPAHELASDCKFYHRESKYELKLQGGKTATWTGRDGVDAAKRYVDCHRDATVIATRQADVYGVFVLGDASQIIG